MKLTITDIAGRNEVDRNAMGGTELMGAGLEKHVDPELLSKFNIIRSRVRHVADDKKNILWLHDLPQDPESAHLADPESLKRFDKIVYVSNWQKDMYQIFMGVPPSQGMVMKNAIEPIEDELIDKNHEEIRLIYHPTPHRGLSLLVPAFAQLAKEYPGLLKLDVFSSFKLYGWEGRDTDFHEIIEACKQHPDINYHGTQPQEVVRAALGKADIFAYPSIWQETSCICAMEAMSAKTLLVCPNYAALPETTAGFALMYDWSENPQEHLNRFYATLKGAIELILSTRAGKSPALNGYLTNQKVYADSQYSWSGRKVEWTRFLNSLT